MSAVTSRKPEAFKVAQVLLDFKANIELANKQGDTVTHYANEEKGCCGWRMA